jgi:carbon starvation protein CstA
MWTGVALGAMLSSLISFDTLNALVPLVVAGQTLGPLLTILLLRWWRFDADLSSRRDVLVFAGASIIGMFVPATIGVSFALMAFTTFVYDTLDVCTRLGRYIVQELTGISGRLGGWLGTGLTAGVPLLFLLRPNLDAQGNPVPAWKMFWNLFGASNQLLAALTLLGVTVWLWRTRREAWVWLVTGVPTAFMYAMSTWALFSLTLPRFRGADGWTLPADPVPWAGLVLLALAAVMLVEAFLAIVEPRNPSGGLSKRAVGSRLAGAPAGS